MMEKLKAVGAKLEVLVHTIVDWATNQIKRLDTPGEIAIAMTVIAVAVDAVTVGHFGVIAFLIGVAKELVEFVAKTSQSGGWIFVVVAIVAFLIIKELKDKK